MLGIGQQRTVVVLLPPETRIGLGGDTVAPEEMSLIRQELVVVLLDEAVDVPFPAAVGATLDVHAGLAADLGGGSGVDRVVGLLLASVADAGEFGVDELLGGSRSPAA